MKLPVISTKKRTLKRKLFGYMCVLVLLLSSLLVAGIFLVGHFTGTKQYISETLEFQTELFERQIDTYYDNLAVMSIQLSQNTTAILENYLDENGITFADLNGSETHIENLQEKLIDAVRQKLWEADCTGTFVMLDTQINSNVQNADTSRTGIYLQRNSLEVADNRVLLYRGIAHRGTESGSILPSESKLPTFRCGTASGYRPTYNVNDRSAFVKRRYILRYLRF